MNRIITICAAVLMTASMFAQSPEKMSYQAVIRDASDNLVTEQEIGMQISILQGTSTGTAVYTETQTPTTNTNGLVSLEIGSGTVVSGTFASIDWSDGPYFIKTETDPAGETSYSITGTSQLMSVPYALHAKTAATVDETDPAYTQSEAANITASDITNLGNLSGTNTGDQDLSGYLTAEADPAYTQSEAANITAIDITNLSNLSGTNTGDQDLSGYLTAETDPTFTSSQAFNIDATDITNLGNLSGVNTGDQDLSGYLTAETDPAFTSSQAFNIDATDITNLGNLSGVNTGDQDLSGYLTAETDPAYTQSEAANITASDITNLSNLSGTNTGDQDLSGYLTAETDPAVAANFDFTNPADGDVLQYDATAGKWLKRTVTGDVTIDNTGATIIGDASVITSKLADEGVTSAKIAVNAVGTSNLQDASVTASKMADASVTNAKLDKTSIPLSGFGAAQADIDLGSNKILFSNVYSSESDLPAASDYHGMFAHVHGTGKAYYAHAGNWVEIANKDQLNLAQVLAENNSANNQQIKNLADPIDAQDALTKAYLDNQGYLNQVPSVTRSIIITPGMIDLDYIVSSGVSKVRFGGWAKPALSLTDDYNSLNFNFPMPSDWNGEQITLKALFSTSDTGKEVVIDISNGGVSLGENSEDGTGGVNSEAVPGSTTTNELMEYTRGLFTQPTDRMVQVFFRRRGLDSRDTSTGNMLVFGFTIEYNTK